VDVRIAPPRGTSRKLAKPVRAAKAGERPGIACGELSASGAHAGIDVALAAFADVLGAE
jgi:hypothetical protein